MRKYKYIDILTNIKCNRNSTICYLFTCYCNSKYTHTQFQQKNNNHIKESNKESHIWYKTDSHF